MGDVFPELRNSRSTQRWGGPLGGPRDWTWTVDFDVHDRVGRMGGYVGDGVTSTYVAGRAMARLIMEGADDLALVGHRSPRWEPEPLRWIGINTANRLASMVDRQESAGRVGGVLSRVVDALIG
ncbi:MAG: FAD-dependent oxidoreductase, partial [Ilumatobacteraceae bacterium]